ncbi:MAG TPA: hypothetical protein VJV79_31445 [Polyangiaceae bacterium]|nr:hypothetical protein [Polyangiaceae bacterium]
MTRLKSISAALCGLLAMSVSGVASAASSDYVIILLDATGSMYPENWKVGLNQAKATVQDYVSLGQNNVTRAFAVYTFKTDSIDGQDGIKQVWPLTTADCPLAQQDKPGTGTATFCGYPAFDEYTKLLGTDTNGDFDNVINGFGPKDGGPSTPLAGSMCNIITAMKNAAGGTNATIVLESDGNENSTPETANGCGGPDAGVAANFVTDNTKDDYGFPLVDGKASWQARVMRRANQYNVASPDLNLPRKGPLPSILGWKVSSIYTFFPATAAGMAAMQQLSAPSTTTAQLSPFGLPDGAQPTFTQQLVRAAAGLSQPAAITMTSTGTTSMSPSELGLFRALGKANARSTYTEFVTVSGQTPVYGVNHKVPGDVDDSGCSDIADYRVIHQKDVWLKRAVAPLQIAIKADLNRDGWVNQADVPVLIANWGKGCKYPVQPPPKL